MTFVDVRGLVFLPIRNASTFETTIQTESKEKNLCNGGHVAKSQSEVNVMEICIKYGGKLHCHYIPIIEYPITFKIPGIGPINYPAFLVDATLVASMHAAASKVSDEKVKAALNSGIVASVKAMQDHAGADVQIKLAGAER